MKKTVKSFVNRSSVVSNQDCWKIAEESLQKEESEGVLIKYVVGKNKFVAMIRKAKEHIVASSWCNGKSFRIYPDISLEAALSSTRSDIASLLILVH